MPIPATNIKTISKIDSFRFIKFSFSACFCSVVIILHFAVQGNTRRAAVWTDIIRIYGSCVNRMGMRCRIPEITYITDFKIKDIQSII